MRFLLLLCAGITFFCSCKSKKQDIVTHNYSDVKMKIIYSDSISIRAIELEKDHLMFAGDNGMYGIFDIGKTFNFDLKKTDTIKYNEKGVHFRAIAANSTAIFVLGIGSPALLYKIDRETGNRKLVYKEAHEKVFYNAVTFWNDKEGIAMGDPTDDCMSIIITRDGGNTWNKVSCKDLPKIVKGEAAFAASNTNIAVKGDQAWVVSGGAKARVLHSKNKGNSWEVYDTPMIQGISTTGIYSVDFYDETIGVIYGGDYLKPEERTKNKAITHDGGKTWQLIANGSGAVYKSCVRYVPNSGGKEMVALGFTGISISNDSGETWKDISDEGFYTLRFLNDSVAVAAGKNRIAKLTFK